MVQTTNLGNLENGATSSAMTGLPLSKSFPSAGVFVPGCSYPKYAARLGGRHLRYLALNDSGIAMASSPLLS
jgi:hypothetical protein